MSSPISFQGLSTNLQTDKLVEAILEQQKAPIQRMQAKADQNKVRASLIRTMRTNLQALNTTLGMLESAFEKRAITSSDPNGTNVTAAASGAAPGNYDVAVQQIATKPRLTSNNSVSSANADLGGTLSKTGTYDYTITNTDGKQFTISLSPDKNTISDLNKAINAKSVESGVSATVIQSSGKNVRLILSGSTTGVGSADKDSDSIFLQGNAGNSLGFLDSGKGSQSTEKAKNAMFSVNGIAMERTSNSVSDVVDGVTFTLKSADANKTTSIAISLDNSAITSAMNDVVTKYNAIYKVYKDNSGQGGAFANDFSLRTMINQAHNALMGAPSDLPGGNAFQTAASLGLKTGKDGMLSLDSAALQDSLNRDMTSAVNLIGKIDSTFKIFVDKAAGFSSGSIAKMLSDIDTQNFRLNQQITDANQRLDKRREALKMQYANLESTVGQLQSMGLSLGGLK